MATKKKSSSPEWETGGIPQRGRPGEPAPTRGREGGRSGGWFS